MKLTRDIHSLSTFKRDTAKLVRQMKKTGQPVILTVNGKAELVVQDAESYQRLLEAQDRIAAIGHKARIGEHETKCRQAGREILPGILR